MCVLLAQGPGPESTSKLRMCLLTGRLTSPGCTFGTRVQPASHVRHTPLDANAWLAHSGCECEVLHFRARDMNAHSCFECVIKSQASGPRLPVPARSMRTSTAEPFGEKKRTKRGGTW